ncbi:MAG TPA: transcription antitermination factor NusB, partial [Chitinophagales bacterium]|nr:transcription antitermination factor NusB [Chitinophagales bacterium]
EILKAIPYNSTNKPDLFEFKITAEEKNFSNQLLIKTMLEDERFDKMVEAKLENWELDRISMIDRILMKMAITEFIHLSTIPVKVTINEYLDISKIYSTPKSKEFINGVLDKIMTELRSSGEIIKTGRGLVE